MNIGEFPDDDYSASELNSECIILDDKIELSSQMGRYFCISGMSVDFYVTESQKQLICRFVDFFYGIAKGVPGFENIYIGSILDVDMTEKSISEGFRGVGQKLSKMSRFCIKYIYIKKYYVIFSSKNFQKKNCDAHWQWQNEKMKRMFPVIPG